jgi:outer membrane protein insertion porin family
VFFIELSQSNFDLFNRRSFFQGDGQKFRLKAQVGSQSSELVLAFEEPWLFEQELALGFQVYRTESDYTSSLYNELRAGFAVYLRSRLFELVEGRLSYRLENVDIFDVSGTLSPEILELLGKSTVSKIGLTLLRDTRDNLITTTRGSQLQAIFELAGGPLGADENYYRLEGQVVQYVPLFDFQQQVLEVAGRLGVIQEYGDSNDVPFYDRYFLGGPQSLRGFEYRKVGPTDEFDEPIGGKTLGYLTREDSIDIGHPVRYAAFYEAGLLNRGSFDFNPGGFNDDFGIGVRFFVLGSPLRLDYGIPLTTSSKNKAGNQFNFSFGTRF